MKEKDRWRYPHKAGLLHWYEEDWGISIYGIESPVGIRWAVLQAAMKRAEKRKINKKK